MAFKSVFSFSVLFLFTYCEAKPENCSEVRCQLLPVGEGFASEFRRKANEKGVRLVYFNLKIGNDSYDPLELQDEFLPHRWVWASTITEPMLSLPEDYDILSLGLLNYQVRHMDVQLQDQPSGCLANLNSTCQNLAVGRMLLENVTLGSSDELSLDIPVVCVAVIKWFIFFNRRYQNSVFYHCCGVHKGTSIPSILCDLTVDKRWLGGFGGITIVLSIFMSLFILALPLALPDGVFSLRRECDKEKLEQRRLNTVAPQDNTEMADQQNMQEVNSEQDESETSTSTNSSINSYQQRQEESEMIPVDDASPITLSTLLLYCAQRMPDVGLSFNIKLFLVSAFVLPCVVYLQLGLYNALETTNINESISKRVSLDEIFTCLPGMEVLGTFLILKKAEMLWLISLILLSLTIGLSFRPKHFMISYCPICMSLRDQSLSDEMRLHFKKLYHGLWKAIFTFAKLVTSNIFLRQCKNSRQPSRRMHLVYVLFRLIYIPFTLLLRVVFGAICFPLFLVYSLLLILLYSPLTLFFTWFGYVLFYFMLELFLDDEDEDNSEDDEDEDNSEDDEDEDNSEDDEDEDNSEDDEDEDNCGCEDACVFKKLTKPGLLLVLSLHPSFVFVYFITMSCSFISKVLGYTIAGLVLNEDLITPYVAFFLVVTTNIYLCYANMQEKYKEVKEMILKCQNELQLNSNDPDGTIRTQLFWFVCGRVLPIKSEICRMFRDMILILAFLFLVVYSVVVFGNQYKASTIFATIYVFVGGLIPVLIFKGLTKRNKFIGWAKMRIEREIEAAVNEYGQRVAIV